MDKFLKEQMHFKLLERIEIRHLNGKKEENLWLEMK